MATGNASNANSTGIVTYNGSGTFTASTVTQYDVLVGGASNAISSIGPGSSGQILQLAGNASNPAYSTATYPSTVAQGDVIYGSSSNVISSLAKDTNSTRYLSNTGASNSPSWAQVALTTGVSGTLPIANGGTNAGSMSTSTGIVKYDGTSLVTSSAAKIDSSNRYTNTSQPCFSVYLSSSLTNFSGDGTISKVTFDSIIYDVGGNFNTTTNTFTAPVTGKYMLIAAVQFNSLTILCTLQGIQIITTSRNYYMQQDYASNVTISAQAGFCISAIADMTANDTASVSAVVSGTTKTIGVLSNGSTDPRTWFMGYLLG